MTEDPTNYAPGNTNSDFNATNEQCETQAESHPDCYSSSTALPESIGKYRILSEIGEGGMGTVYEAEQDSPRRKVALKVIKAGVASKNLLLRFEIEAQILGKLDHSGIATIFEAGTFDEGYGKQPFFAMEFVQGDLLTDYAEKHKLGTRDRLGLLAKIADAVQHAHQKGVIHRDLKPANILVNNEGQIKILDFGVARATDADIQTATMQTDIGQLIGTIPYMSPEQASGDPDDLDTRSDVYALGIIAYELLTGQMPYNVKQKMIHEAVRVIREDEPKTLSSINKTFRGDVEIIVSKALIKEKERRYQSASDLASDIHRYLNNEPIEARPPSSWYQLSKFSRRNKALVVGVAAVLLVSVAGALVSINFAMGEAEQKQIALDNAEQARAAEANTQRELTRANEVKNLITDMLSSITPEEAQGQDITMLKGILDKTGERLSNNEIADELIAAELHHVIGNAYWSLGLYKQAELHQPAALEIRKRVLGEEHPNTLLSMGNLASLYHYQGRYAEAEPLHIQTLELSKLVLGEEHLDTLLSMGNLASLYKVQGRYTEAEPLFIQTIELSKRVLGEEHPNTLLSMGNLANLYRTQGRYAEAEPLFIQTVELSKRVLGEEHPDTLHSMGSLANLYNNQGRYAEAEPLYIQTLELRKRVLGEEHPSILHSMGNLALLYNNQGRYDEAEPLLIQTIELRKRVLGEGHPDILISMGYLALLYNNQGRYDEAEPLFIQTIELSKRVLSEEHPYTLISMGNLANLYQDQGRYAEAEPLFIQTIELSKRVLGEEHPNTLLSMGNLANLYRTQGRYAEAEPLERKLFEFETASADAPGADSNTLNTAAWSLLTHVTESLRDPQRALGYAQSACAMAESSEPQSLWMYLDTLALAQYMTGDTASAVETQRSVVSLMPEGADSSVPENLAKYESALADEAREPEMDD